MKKGERGIFIAGEYFIQYKSFTPLGSARVCV